MPPQAEQRELFRELAARPAGTWVTCASGSMEPTIKVGDRVRVHACSGTDLRPGQVVLFETGDGKELVLHRVVLAVPGLPYFLHIGDAGRARGPGICHRDRVIARADLPVKRPSLAMLAAAARRTIRAAGNLGHRWLKRHWPTSQS